MSPKIFWNSRRGVAAPAFGPGTARKRRSFIHKAHNLVYEESFSGAFPLIQAASDMILCGTLYAEATRRDLMDDG